MKRNDLIKLLKNLPEDQDIRIEVDGDLVELARIVKKQEFSNYDEEGNPLPKTVLEKETTTLELYKV